jgi:hypothetical protein
LPQLPGARWADLPRRAIGRAEETEEEGEVRPSPLARDSDKS